MAAEMEQDQQSPDSTDSEPTRSTFTHFFDLPQEVRDMIYNYWPNVAWIDITQTHPRTHTMNPEKDKSVNQPTPSKVCRRMRDECLDVFYGKNKFLLDLRGWKHNDYPMASTPAMIFERWITGIGDENAGRIRSLSFWSHNFAVHIKMSTENPEIALKFRAATAKPELAENVPVSYSFQIAAGRAELAMRQMLDNIEAEADGKPLTAQHLIRVCKFVEKMQPYLCKRNNLGYKNTVLPSNDVTDWPSIDAHLDKCDDCGYHRYTRGKD